MKLFRILYIISILLPLNIFGQQTNNTRPRLIVGIMVDGLQQKHIDLLWTYFDSGGFKKIIEQGTGFENMSYNIVSAGNASDIATVMSGSVPYYHGIAGNLHYSRNNDKVQSVLFDDQEIGIGTKETFSAHNLLTSTLNDEIVMASGNKSKSYAVAIDAEAAIMMGGHTANSVAWIDDIFHKWVTTGYYREGLNRWADEMNVGGRFKTYSTRKWEPLYSVNTYVSSATDNRKNGFAYDPTDKASKSSSNTILKRTAAANALVADLGLKIFSEEKLGTGPQTDILMLQFTVRTPNEKLFSMQTLEKEDIYLRLDKEIQFLLQQIEARTGADKTLIYMFGNQNDVHSPNELGKNKIPAGYFNASRSMALVNTYLMAIYGQDRWIEGYYGKNIFLNKKKIEEKKLNFREIQQQVADFMLEFEGVHSAFTSTQILTMGGNTSSEMLRLRNSSHKSSAGDVVITLLPGWLEVDDKMNPVGESNAIISYTPAYFYGWNVKKKTINKPYQVTDLAPTISRMLNIPMPNAVVGSPVTEMFETIDN